MKISLLALLVILVSLQVAHGWYYGYHHRPSYGFGYGYRPSYGYGYGYGYRPPVYGGGYYGSYYGRRSFFTRDLTESDPVKSLFVKPECVYYKGDGRLVCQGGSITVQCDADLYLNLTSRFEFLAIESIPFNENCTSFDLYPRSMDNEFWLNHTVWMDNQFVSFSLFYSNVTTPNLYGIRVVDSHCFSDVMYLFAKSTFNYVIGLETNQLYKFHDANVTILGDILITA